MRSRRSVDWIDVTITAAIGVAAAFALFVLLAFPARAQDITVPAEDAPLVSSVVRDNFSTINDRLNNSNARFPGTTCIDGMVTYSTSDGFLDSECLGFQFTSGSSVPFTILNTVTAVQSYANNTAFPSFKVDVSGGTANIFELINGSDRWWQWSANGSLTTDFPGTAQFNITSGGANLNWISNQVSNDALGLNCTNMVLGDCLDIDEDGTQRLKLEVGGAFSLVGTTVIPFTVTQATAGSVVSTEKTTTTGDDPTMNTLHGRVATTDATTTTIATIAVATSTVIQVECKILARVTAGSGGNAGVGAGYKIIDEFKNVAGTVTRLEGSAATAIETAEDAALSAYAVALSISTTNVIATVTGQANDTTTWHAFCEYASVGS